MKATAELIGLLIFPAHLYVGAAAGALVFLVALVRRRFSLAALAVGLFLVWFAPFGLILFWASSCGAFSGDCANASDENLFQCLVFVGILSYWFLLVHLGSATVSKTSVALRVAPRTGKTFAVVVVVLLAVAATLDTA
ncbi:hypothetical protein OOT46_02610 [Aquabacterium sp. A7-Y]|uniref:hypothetical protein n=1 Tax=Aquabacterium sp. A7-Y TaxID=1349605 RepID=UPI00223DB08B|nr:hypothetical protein [Aquabacterium sp. A7-Y]MCW7536744.1 hypothetical protein [Aquabacterium sp. A7-Y]